MDGPVVIVMTLAGWPKAQQAGTHAERFKMAARMFEEGLRPALESGLPVLAVAHSTWLDLARRHLAARDVLEWPPRHPAGSAVPASPFATGVMARPNAAGWMLWPPECPSIPADSFRQVARALKKQPLAFVQQDGQSLYPMGFSQELYSDLVQLTSDAMAPRLLARYPGCAIELVEAASG
jgi:molybdenum cofactor cytidylyltransferase